MFLAKFALYGMFGFGFIYLAGGASAEINSAAEFKKSKKHHIHQSAFLLTSEKTFQPMGQAESMLQTKSAPRAHTKHFQLKMPYSVQVVGMCRESRSIASESKPALNNSHCIEAKSNASDVVSYYGSPQRQLGFGFMIGGNSK